MMSLTVSLTSALVVIDEWSSRAFLISRITGSCSIPVCYQREPRWDFIELLYILSTCVQMYIQRECFWSSKRLWFDQNRDPWWSMKRGIGICFYLCRRFYSVVRASIAWAKVEGWSEIVRDKERTKRRYEVNVQKEEALTWLDIQDARNKIHKHFD